MQGIIATAEFSNIFFHQNFSCRRNFELRFLVARYVNSNENYRETWLLKLSCSRFCHFQIKILFHNLHQWTLKTIQSVFRTLSLIQMQLTGLISYKPWFNKCISSVNIIFGSCIGVFFSLFENSTRAGVGKPACCNIGFMIPWAELIKCRNFDFRVDNAEKIKAKFLEYRIFDAPALHQ